MFVKMSERTSYLSPKSYFNYLICTSSQTQYIFLYFFKLYSFFYPNFLALPSNKQQTTAKTNFHRKNKSPQAKEQTNGERMAAADNGRNQN